MREREIVVHIDFSVVATNMKLKASIIMFMCIYMHMHMFCNSPHPKHALSVASLVRTSSCKEKAVLNQP